MDRTSSLRAATEGTGRLRARTLARRRHTLDTRPASRAQSDGRGGKVMCIDRHVSACEPEKSEAKRIMPTIDFYNLAALASAGNGSGTGSRAGDEASGDRRLCARRGVAALGAQRESQHNNRNS